MTHNIPYPVLYVIVRDDIPSMNAGKAEAHSGHAVSHFWHKVTCLSNAGTPVNTYFKEWLDSANGFGTQINLQGGLEEILGVAHYLQADNSLEEEGSQTYLMGTVVDPTYPWLCPITGKHRTREEVTAFWFFGMSDEPVFSLLKSKLKLKK